MTAIFDGYDEEYKTITSAVSTKISEVASYEDDNERKKATINHIGDLCKQASQLIQQMELEVRSLDSGTKKELTKKVNMYKTSLKSLQADYKKLREKADREGLFGEDERDGIEMGSMAGRDRMAKATGKLKGTSDRIASAKRTIADTEEVALTITEELARNREKIEGTRDKLKDVNSMTSIGGKIIGRMTSRDRKQRICLYFVMLFLCVALVLILYFTLFAQHSSSTTTTTTSDV